MKIINIFCISLSVALAAGCADNSLDEQPQDDNFPFRLVLDAEEGGDLPDAEDFDVEVKFADILPSQALPNTPITLDYTIGDVEGDMAGVVAIDKIVYEVEVDGCVYEREVTFAAAADGLTGTITLEPDADLGSVPEAFEIVLLLPGLEETEGGFTLELSNLQSPDNLLLGSPNIFEYSVLDNDVAGEWELTLESEEAFEAFQEVFGPLHPDLETLAFEDITGNVGLEFEFEEMKFIIELAETEDITTCEDGEEETETVNKVIEIEAEYDAEDGEAAFEGSHEIVNDEGVVETELDFIIESEYETDGASLTLNFLKVMDEDHFEDDDTLFASEEGLSFTFEKD